MYIGVKTEKSGGRVDIVLDDHKGCGVIIENKVDAGDQENQLLRYDNYAKKYFKKDYRLLYLTLDGHKPSAKFYRQQKNLISCILFLTERKF